MKSLEILRTLESKTGLSPYEESKRILISAKQWYRILGGKVQMPDYSSMCKIAFFFSKDVTDIFLPSEYAFRELITNSKKHGKPFATNPHIIKGVANNG